jgi:MFS family permease
MRTLRRYPRFAIFFAGQAVSLVGSWMTRVALSWLVYRLTGSVMMLGWVAFAGQAPISVFALLGGALVDRWDRRRVLIGSKLVAAGLAAALAALTLNGAASLPALFVLATLQGLQTAVDMPARQALLPGQSSVISSNLSPMTRKPESLTQRPALRSFVRVFGLSSPAAR